LVAKQSVNQMVYEILIKDLPHQHNKFSMAYRIKKLYDKDIPQNQIKVAFTRLLKKNRIERTGRGFYRVKVTPDILYLVERPPVELHGIKLELCFVKKFQNTIDGITSKSFTDDMLLWFRVNGFCESTNYRWGRVVFWEDRRIRVTVHLNGLIEIFINASSRPLDLKNMYRCLDFLEGFLSRICVFDYAKISVVQVGMAKDFRSLRLDGVRCITLHKYLNDWTRVYYKEDIGAVRFEHHSNFDDRCVLHLDEALNTLEVLTSPPVRHGVGRPDERRDVV